MKKPSVVSFLITLLLAAAAVCIGKQLVKDTAGNPLQPHKLYFIQPVKTESNNGGGLVPAAIKILPFCPLGITQTLLPYQPGLPVSFSVRLVAENYITTSSIVSIEFRSNIWPVCNEFSKLWKVDDHLSVSEEPAILIGAGGGQELNGFFSIGAGTGENTYKLYSFFRRGTVGTIPGAWLNAPQLVLTNDNAKILLVKFKAVDDATTATTSTSQVEKLGLRMFPFY